MFQNNSINSLGRIHPCVNRHFYDEEEGCCPVFMQGGIRGNFWPFIAGFPWEMKVCFWPFLSFDIIIVCRSKFTWRIEIASQFRKKSLLQKAPVYVGFCYFSCTTSLWPYLTWIFPYFLVHCQHILPSLDRHGLVISLVNHTHPTYIYKHIW